MERDDRAYSFEQELRGAMEALQLQQNGVLEAQRLHTKVVIEQLERILELQSCAIRRMRRADEIMQAATETLFAAQEEKQTLAYMRSILQRKVDGNHH